MLIAAVGAAFALSFDTISQAVLFSITGSNLAGWAFATVDTTACIFGRPIALCFPDDPSERGFHAQ